MFNDTLEFDGGEIGAGKMGLVTFSVSQQPQSYQSSLTSLSSFIINTLIINQSYSYSQSSSALLKYALHSNYGFASRRVATVRKFIT